MRNKCGAKGRSGLSQRVRPTPSAELSTRASSIRARIDHERCHHSWRKGSFLRIRTDHHFLSRERAGLRVGSLRPEGEPARNKFRNSVQISSPPYLESNNVRLIRVMSFAIRMRPAIESHDSASAMWSVLHSQPPPLPVLSNAGPIEVVKKEQIMAT